jgi:hypothetical protein
MAKKVRTQIDINDIFMANAHDDASKAVFVRSELWPIAVSIYALTDRVAKIGPVATDGNFVAMTTDEGFTICGLQRWHDGSGKDRYALLRSDGYATPGGLHNRQMYTSQIESYNPRYIINKLKASSVGNVRDAILECATNAKTAVHTLMDTTLHETKRLLDANKRPTIGHGLPHDDIGLFATNLADVYFGSGESVTLEDRQELRDRYDAYIKKLEVFNGNLNRVLDMFSTDKWVVMPNTLGGMIIGAVTRHPLQVALETYKKYNRLPNNHNNTFNYADISVPFRWYKNMDCVPANIRSDVEIAMMMLKTHTNTPDLPDIHHNDKVWESVESIAISNYKFGHAPIYILPK